MKTLILTLLGSLFFIASGGVLSFAQTLSLKPVTGGFIQYNSGIIKTKDNPNGWSKENWEAELKAFQEAGMDTIIIQFLELNKESYVPNEKDKLAVDPTEAILSYADAHGIKIYIGLWNKEWGSAKIRNLDNDLVSANKENCKRVAKIAWKKYGKHSSFVGWYIPQEIWNIKWKPEQIIKMRKLYRQISDNAKKLDQNKKPVAISPYFDPNNNDGDDPNPEETYKSLLKDSGIDLLMLQDGVGANCLETKDQINSAVKHYFQQFHNATKAAGIRFWANLESFKTVSGGCLDDFQTAEILEPTNFNRFSAQIEAASMNSSDGAPMFENFVTFDFFEFMSPIHPGKTLAARNQLYNDYKQNFVDTPR